jgi:hypothetical protein
MALLITKIKNEFHGIVCHNNHGNLLDLLNEYYNDDADIGELFSLGEIVYLHSDIGKQHHSKQYQEDVDLIARNNMWSTFKQRDHMKNGSIYKGVSLIDVIIQSNQGDVFLFENLKWKHLTGI